MTQTLDRIESDATPDATVRINRRRSSTRSRVWGVVALVAISAVTVIPIALLIVNSLNAASPGDPASYGFGNWKIAFGDPGLSTAILNTLRLGVTRTLIALVIATTIAWFITRTDMAFGKVVQVSLWLAFFVPSLSMTVGWVLLLDSNSGALNTVVRTIFGLGAGDGPFNINSFWGIIWTHISASTVPLMTILLIPSFKRMGSVMEESAQTCGASRWRTAWHVTIPLMTPALIGAALLGFINSLKAFEIELVLGAPIGLRVFSTQIYDWTLHAPPNYGAATALGIVFIPIMVLLAVGQRIAIKRRSYITVSAHTFKDEPLRLGRRKRWVVGSVGLLYVAVMVWLPLAAIVTGSFMRRFGFFNIENPFTSEHWTELLSNDMFGSAVTNSLILGLVATVFGVLIYFFIGFAIVRSKLPTRGAIDVMAWLPVALPGILLGLGLIWLYLGTPLRTVLYGNLFGLAIALIITHMATGTQQMKTAFMQVSEDLERAARTCGAKPWRAGWHILMPLLAPATVGVAILAFDSAIRDVSTVVLLSSADSTPASLLLLQYSTSNQLESASALGVIMAIVTVIVGLLATKLASRRQVGSSASISKRAKRAADKQVSESVTLAAAELEPAGAGAPPTSSTKEDR
jgi:iron(III) transport system permease protein